MYILAQTVGILAVALFLLSYQLKTRKNIIIVNLTSRILYIIQYLILGAIEGAVLDFSGFILSFFARHKDKELALRHFKKIMTVILLSLVILGVYLYENIFSIFAILGIMLEVVALWLTKEKNIRFLSLFAAPSWLVYNLNCRAYGSAVGNVLGIISMGFAMIRLDLKKYI